MKNSVTLYDVGPRDGLQNDSRRPSLAARIHWIESLAQAGIKNIEAGAFVRSDRVPAMADSEELVSSLMKRGLPTTLWSLVPNERGLERAIAANSKAVGVFTAASETFANKNIGMSIEESLSEFAKVVPAALKAGIQVRGYVSTVFGCPFEGRIQWEKSLPIIEQLLAMGCEQVSLGDTIGVAVPPTVALASEKFLKTFGAGRVAMHMHDTRGTALANVWAAYQSGITHFDASSGGLGGCPFAPGATGNVALEELLYLFQESSVATGIDYEEVCTANIEFAQALGGPEFSSRALRAFIASDVKNPWDHAR
jgi:hydroxymethylglutaryl-CoA lyase